MSTTIPGKCEDFDECAASATANSATQYAYNCAANSYCLNTIGSHLCICNDGFMGNGMDITGGCSDIDEWLVSNFILIHQIHRGNIGVPSNTVPLDTETDNTAFVPVLTTYTTVLSVQIVNGSL